MKDKTITTEQFNLMAKHIVSILSSANRSCSFRYLIYSVMGLDETYYSLLYPAIQDLTNTLAEVTETLKEIEQLQAENEKMKVVLEKILKREACTCNAYDCDCTWELVCKAIDPKRWAKLQARKGGEK